MARGVQHSWLWIAILAALPAAGRADEGAYKKSQFYRGITAHHVVTTVLEADVDGDGRPEQIICYRQPEDAVDQQGGVLILTGEPPEYRVAWHAMFEKVYPIGVKAAGKALTFTLVRKGAGAEKKIEKTLVKGKDFFFRNEPGSPLSR